MSFPSSLNVALKEWASVCDALETGRQILLLRKGGIHESAGEFALEHPQFLLFPTYLHQNIRMLKPSEHAAFVPMSAEPDKITLAALGVATDIVRVGSRRQMDALDAEHIWARPLIDMRFAYRPENPLYLLLVRAYLLSRPVTIDNTPDYAGCKSWVPLTQAIDAHDAAAVLPDADYERRKGAIMERIA
ncbi:MAG: DUF1802 family protein [Tepidisphaeraceae bacterium]|jgi:hypothetical protein